MQPVALQKEDIRKAVVVVIEDRHPSACVFHDVGLIDLAGNHFSGESRLRRDIAEIHLRCLHSWRKRTHRRILCVPRSHLRKQLRSESQQSAHRCEHCGKRHESPDHKYYCAFPAADRRTAFVPGQSSQGRVWISGSVGLSVFAASSSFSPSSRSPAWQSIEAKFLVQVGLHRTISAFRDALLSAAGSLPASREPTPPPHRYWRA